MINRLPHKQFRLITLGGLALRGDDGAEEPTIGSRRRKLALLTVLALEQRPLSRDRLADFFWGERAEDRAKHSLSDAVSHLRQVLGPDALRATRTGIELTGDAPLTVDARELVSAAAERDDVRVISLYGGPFLDGVHVGALPSFEQWADERRHAFDRLFANACRRSGQGLLADGRADNAAGIAERWLAADPTSEHAALLLLDALARSDDGGPARALAAYEELRRRIERQFEMSPAPAVTERAAAIAAGLRTTRAQRDTDAASIPAPASPALLPGPPAKVPSTRGARSPSASRYLAPSIGAAVLLGFITIFALARSPEPISHSDDAFIIAPFSIVQGADSVSWLDQGLPRLLAAKLSRAGVEATVPEAFVGDTLRAARRMAARWLVTGAVRHHDALLTVDITLRDPSSGAVTTRTLHSGSNIIALADEAGSQLLATTLNASATGPALAEVETRSAEAYRHYVNAVRARIEGRPHDMLDHLDRAIALDSGFLTAVYERLRLPPVATDTGAARTLLRLIQLHRPRLSRRDALEMEARAAFQRARHAEADALARELVRRYPRDPRSYEVAVEVLGYHGHFRAADSLFVAAARLDSTFLETTGVCRPCADYGALVGLRWNEGDTEGAEHLARRYTAAHPQLPSAWLWMLRTLARRGKYAEALMAGRRGRMLDPENATFDGYLALVHLAARDFSRVDSALALMAQRSDPRSRTWTAHVRMALQRERGQYRAAATTGERMARELDASMILVAANSMARAGDHERARRAYEHVGAHPPWTPPFPDFVWSIGSSARSFTWHHALEADALASRCDRLHLSALADSLETLGALSYYARDWRLHHHVRGLIALCDRQYDDAAASLRRAGWFYDGWLAILAALAYAELERGKPHVAMATIRTAYQSLPEGMGWYVPRSELDFLMSRALALAGQTDSARIYAAHVRKAWASADANVRRRLATLP